jgi:uncharacterized spore protein YtfJ
MRLTSDLESLFDNIKLFSRSENFIGQPVRIENITLIPILSLSFGAGGSTAAKGSGAGAGGKISPLALLVIKDEDLRLFSLSSQNDLQDISGLLPEIIASLKTSAKAPPNDYH